MQLTYSTTRFGVYEMLKSYMLPADGCELVVPFETLLHCVENVFLYCMCIHTYIHTAPLPFHYKIIMGATGGKKIESEFKKRQDLSQ